MMAEFASIPFYTDAWIADTGHLSRLQRGLYMDLLVLCWRSPECRVPNDIDWISRKLKCSEDEIGHLKDTLNEFFTIDGSHLYQKRLLKEFQYCRKVREANSRGGKSRWGKEKSSEGQHKESTRTAQGQHKVTTPPYPTHYYKKGNSKNGKEGSKKTQDKVPVFIDTPQWEAWKQAYGSKPLPVVDIRSANGGPIRRGWYFPTEFPQPAAQKAEP